MFSLVSPSFPKFFPVFLCFPISLLFFYAFPCFSPFAYVSPVFLCVPIFPSLSYVSPVYLYFLYPGGQRLCSCGFLCCQVFIVTRAKSFFQARKTSGTQDMFSLVSSWFPMFSPGAKKAKRRKTRENIEKQRKTKKNTEKPGNMGNIGKRGETGKT